MGKSPADKANGTRAAITLGVLLWAGLLALFLIPSWDADVSAGFRIGVVLGITAAAVGGTWRMVETAQADHIETRGDKTILYFEESPPPPEVQVPYLNVNECKLSPAEMEREKQARLKQISQWAKQQKRDPGMK